MVGQLPDGFLLICLASLPAQAWPQVCGLRSGDLCQSQTTIPPVHLRSKESGSVCLLYPSASASTPGEVSTKSLKKRNGDTCSCSFPFPGWSPHRPSQRSSLSQPGSPPPQIASHHLTRLLCLFQFCLVSTEHKLHKVCGKYRFSLHPRKMLEGSERVGAPVLKENVQLKGQLRALGVSKLIYGWLWMEPKTPNR